MSPGGLVREPSSGYPKADNHNHFLKENKGKETHNGGIKIRRLEEKIERNVASDAC